MVVRSPSISTGGRRKKKRKTLEIASPKFKPLIQPYRYKVLYGGRGGAKSRTVGRVLLLMGTQKPLRVLCTRETQKSIADSVKKLLDDEIRRMELGLFYQSIHTAIRGANGTEFLFSGLSERTASGVKSFEDIDICWIEEADTLSEFSVTTLFPTIRAAGSEIWITFNPRFATDPVYDRFFGGEPPPRTVLINVGWQDNRFFPKELEEERQWLKRRDYEKYLHVWEGHLITMSEARIFKNWEVKEFETPPGTQVFLGCDWGMAVDPSCIVGCWFDDANRALYIDREAHAQTTDIAELPPLFARCPGSKKWPITFDSSRPELGKELKKHGYRMKPARKGPNSIMEGIEFLQSYKIFVHPRCTNTIYELSHYSYKVDKKTEKVILPAVPEDKNNHVIDSLRYSVESRWMQNKTDWIKRLNA